MNVLIQAIFNGLDGGLGGDSLAKKVHGLVYGQLGNGISHLQPEVNAVLGYVRVCIQDAHALVLRVYLSLMDVVHVPSSFG